MIFLKGKNLCERQKELNFKVKEAVQNNIEFQELKLVQEQSDVDRLFKIDLASKHKNIDYIIEQLKCGDTLYISRALKCQWIYGDDYVHIINPDYLHHNVFPMMSLKMKTKTLSSISIYIRDKTRAQLFFEYCTNIDMANNAYKFLIFTSESFKEEYLNDKNNCHKIYMIKENFKDLIGNSLTLADNFSKNGGNITDLSYLYTVNNEEYLNLLEKHININHYSSNISPIGGKMSRSILKKQKPRMLKNPLLYLKVLKKSEIIKYTSSEEAKIYAVALLPEDVHQFWSNYKSNRYIIDLIKTDSIYTFLKLVFHNKYPKEEFETSKHFFNLKYYDFMTVTEIENWALKQLDLQTGVIPEDEDYRWFEFVAFPRAFEEMKKKILLTTHSNKRSAMLNVLVKSAKTQRDLEDLMNYYYKRHVNEKIDLKERFVESVIKHHNVFEFDDACWGVFDKLLHSLNIYLSIGSNQYTNNAFLDISLVYHIINKRTFPNNLDKYIIKLNLNRITRQTDELTEEKRNLVYDFLFMFYIDKLKNVEYLDYNNEVQVGVRHNLKKIIELKRSFKKQGDYPEIALKYMKLDLENFEDIFKINPKTETKTQDVTEAFLLRCLKQNPVVILENFSLLQEQIKMQWKNDIRLNVFLRKLKTYFSNDLAKQYLALCTETLSSTTVDEFRSRNVIFANIFAIFQLGDEHFKSDLMVKHTPTSSKIEHDKIDSRLLHIQEAICRLHWYSRPTVPLSKTALYLKGDYVHMMNDMFNMYLMNLTPNLRTEFINLTLNSPVSVQKRGLRLAFKIFETDVLKDIVLNVWTKTKNVSVRSNLYKLILAKMIKENEKSQLKLFELLKKLTASIHKDDDEEVFKCFSGHEIPVHLRGSYLESAWNTVSDLPEKRSNIERRMYVVKAMEANMSLMGEAYVESLIERYVHRKLVEHKLSPEKNPDVSQFNEAFWNFVVKYIVNIPNEVKQIKSLNLIKLIINECFNHWNETYGTEKLVYQFFFKELTVKLYEKTSLYGKEYSEATHIFKYLLETFEEKFGIAQMYFYYWDWKLWLLTKTVIGGRDNSDRDVHINFGLQLGMLIKELKEKRCYYISFLDKIFGIVLQYIRILSDGRVEPLTTCDVKILIAYGLTRSVMFEVHVLALRILPEDSCKNSTTENELREVIKSIKEQNDDELGALMNDKFIYTDHKFRKIFM